MDQQLLYEETEAEVRSQEELTSEIITEGRNLSAGESNSSCYFCCQGLHTCHLLSPYLVYTDTVTGQHLQSTISSCVLSLLFFYCLDNEVVTIRET